MNSPPNGKIAMALRHIRPGDVIGFSANDPLGAAINVSTLGWPFSPACWKGLTHIGIVSVGSNDQFVLWEATTLCDLPCLSCGREHSGLQAHGIQARVESYQGAVWHYPLRLLLGTIEQRQVALFAKKHHARTYDYLGAAQSRSLCLGWVRRSYMRESLSSLFCSEFVAGALDAAEVWDTPNASAWNPNRLARTLVAVGITKQPRRLK